MLTITVILIAIIVSNLNKRIMFKVLWPWSAEIKEFAAFQQAQKEEKDYSKEIASPYTSQDPEYIYDFLGWSSSYGSYYNRSIQMEGPPATPEEAMKVRVKPIDVVESLYTSPQSFLDVALIDEKIAMFKEKQELINNNYSQEEVAGFIERLENRKKYAESREYFEGFQTTTDEKIGQLLDTYPELARKPVELFIPDFPKEAINRMKSYTAKVKDITGKKPVYYVIAEADKFRKAYEKRDPILLAQSPFGFYWYILGAWDKEMLMLSEL